MRYGGDGDEYAFLGPARIMESPVSIVDRADGRSQRYVDGARIDNPDGRIVTRQDLDLAEEEYIFFSEKFDLDIPEQHAKYCKIKTEELNGRLFRLQEFAIWVERTSRYPDGRTSSEVHLVKRVDYALIRKILRPMV
jgi:hypothetical protein